MEPPLSTSDDSESIREPWGDLLIECWEGRSDWRIPLRIIKPETVIARRLLENLHNLRGTFTPYANLTNFHLNARPSGAFFPLRHRINEEVCVCDRPDGR